MTGQTVRRTLGREGGFTLIELMVVVLIIGILIAIALGTYIGARERASDRAAQSNLRSGLVAGMVYESNGGGFAGFGVVQAAAIEDSLRWVASGTDPVPGEITIQIATATDMLLVSRSGAGTYFCISQQAGNPGTDRGQGAAFGDVDTVVECTGGW